MSENMEAFRHLDGGGAVIDKEFIKVVFQHGDPKTVGINGCRVEDVIEVVIQKLLDFQGRALSCPENAEALYHLEMAQEALVRRRRAREQQGVLGTTQPHASGATGFAEALS